MRREASWLATLLVGGFVILGLGCRSEPGAETVDQEALQEAETAEEELPDLDPVLQREAQLASLRHLYYRNNPPPPPPTEEELAGMDAYLTAVPEEESGYLEEYYRQDKDLLIYAMRARDASEN